MRNDEDRLTEKDLKKGKTSDKYFLFLSKTGGRGHSTEAFLLFFNSSFRCIYSPTVESSCSKHLDLIVYTSNLFIINQHPRQHMP